MAPKRLSLIHVRISVRSLFIAAIVISIICIKDVLSLSTAPASGRLTLGSLSIRPVAIGTLRLDVNNDRSGDYNNRGGDGGGNGNNEATNEASKLLSSAPIGTLIDTAELYRNGKIESLLREASRRSGRTLGSSDLPVATKFAPSPFRIGPDSVIDACQRSARRLGVDKIDLYQIHFRDVVQPLAFLGLRNEKDESYWDGLAECYHAGLVSNVGVCNYGPVTVRRVHDYLAKRNVPLASNQINFNLMRYRSSLGTKRVCDELGIRILAYHPLGNGALGGRYDLNDLSTLPVGPSKRRRMKWYLRNSAPVIDAVRRIASSNGRSCAQVATNWIVCKGAVPIAGPRDADQFLDSLGSAGWSLSKAEVEELDEASDASAEYEKGFELV